MGVATGYDWYKLEPFVNSFKRYVKNADLILFVDNISDFTRDALTQNNVGLLPIPNEFKNKLMVSVRWMMYKNFLDERGKDYRQVFLTDTRDVIFQGDVFETYADVKNFLGYVTEGEFIKNCPFNFDWLEGLFRKEIAEKLKNEEIICSGTILGTVTEIKNLCVKMSQILHQNTIFGADQGAENYLVRENLLDVENIFEINCEHGNILTAGYFFYKNPIKIENDKILRGDGGIPAVVHQYDRHPALVQLIDKLYRDNNFHPNKNFTDTRSMLEQILHLANLDRIDDAYKLFTQYLFGKNFVDYVGKLLELWETILRKSFTYSSELLMLSIQGALMSTNGNSFNLGNINKALELTNFCMKNHVAVSYPFKIFMGNILINLTHKYYSFKQLEKCIDYLNFINELDTPKDTNFYLFQAKVYRESGKKAEALAAYEKALG